MVGTGAARGGIGAAGGAAGYPLRASARMFGAGGIGGAGGITGAGVTIPAGGAGGVCAPMLPVYCGAASFVWLT